MLLTIAEIAVAFAGFASVVVLFQHRDPHDWPVAVVVRLRTMIEGSLVTLFSALLPFVLHHLGLQDGGLWALSSFVLAIVYLGFGARVWRRSRAALVGGQLSRSFTGTAAVISALVVAALILNALGLLFPRAFGAYLLGVTWTLAFASLMFLRVAAFPSGGGSGE